MKRTASLLALACLFLGTSCARFEKAPPETLEDDTLNTILARVLSQSHKYGCRPSRSGEHDGYVVVDPETALELFDPKDREAVRGLQEHFQQALDAEGGDVGGLIERLFEENKKPFLLSLESSAQDGYVIDHDGEYARYFEKHGGGWEELYEEHPEVRGCTRVSVPVYDAESQIVFVYVGTQWHWLAGRGWIIAFKYEDGELTELAREMVWIS